MTLSSLRLYFKELDNFLARRHWHLNQWKLLNQTSSNLRVRTSPWQVTFNHPQYFSCQPNHRRNRFPNCVSNFDQHFNCHQSSKFDCFCQPPCQIRLGCLFKKLSIIFDDRIWSKVSILLSQILLLVKGSNNINHLGRSRWPAFVRNFQSSFSSHQISFSLITKIVSTTLADQVAPPLQEFPLCAKPYLPNASASSDDE